MWTIGFIVLMLLLIVNISGLMKHGVNRTRYLFGTLITLTIVLVFFGIGPMIAVAALAVVVGHYARNQVLSFVE
jgi:hypothetical protein